MKSVETAIPGVFVFEGVPVNDLRGVFSKPYNKDIFESYGLSPEFHEVFFTTSHQNVIRGMHFQTPPVEHDKLVFVPNGRITDVILDLRSDLPTYGKAISVELCAENQNSVFVPVGCAHGYKVLEEGSIVVYMVTTVYAPECDMSIRWDSFGFDWEIDSPILSDKDKTAVSFSEYKSPFRLKV